jgi:hypothetical protein
MRPGRHPGVDLLSPSCPGDKDEVANHVKSVFFQTDREAVSELPYIDEMRGLPGGSRGSFFSTPIPVTQPTAGGGTTPSTTSLQEIAEAGAIQILPGSPPSASKPSEGLPANARPGRFYPFASSPGTLFTLGPDNVWRGLLLLPVT